MTPQDLLLFTGSVYGAAWILTKSRLLAAPRAFLKDKRFIGPLSQCIVCTSVWVAAALASTARFSSLLPSVRPTAVMDYVVLLAWTSFSSWLFAHHLGDAD